MLEFVERPAVLTLAATIASFVCFIAGTRELRRGLNSRTGTWWVFSVLLFGIALAHAWNLGGAAAESGREVFRLEGIYGVRRPVQALVIIVVAAATVITLLAGPPIVRRYAGDEFVSPAVVLFGIVGYLTVRTISLHQVDSVLYGRHIFAAHPGTLIELAGLFLFIYVALRAAEERQGTPRKARGGRANAQAAPSHD